MKKICLVALSFVAIISAEAQTIKTKLDAAVKQLEKDAQLKHGLIGFAVIDAATGKPVYERNGEIGLAPASTQKVFTSIAAFELLGKDFRYKTSFGYSNLRDYEFVRSAVDRWCAWYFAIRRSHFWLMAFPNHTASCYFRSNYACI